ncbi:MAG: PKD domain-containing protein, partial [Bacteroidia bacterium]|nr:PKD domain-containing protein [Bacteroidia bacterium]
SNRLRALYFVNASTGWLVGNDEYIVKTTNGGVSWTTQIVSGGPGMHLRSVFFFDSNNGWAVGNNGSIVATTDGGNNWIPQTSNTNEKLYGVYFLSSLVGWVVGNGDMVLRTYNGGNTWNTITSTGTGEDLRGVNFVNESTGWVAGKGDVIAMTTDTGNTWATQSTGTGEDLFGIHMLSASLGWVCGSGGVVSYYGNGEPPVADFTTNTSVCLGAMNTFTDNSAKNPTNWFWNFGDGNTSTNQDDTHSYLAEGIYDAYLVVSNGTGCTDTMYQTIYVSGADPVANFTASPTTVCTGEPVSFTDITFSLPSVWDWDFGDGNNSNLQNPTHQYMIAGTYSITLIATNGCNNDTEFKVSHIVVNDGPVANFSDDAPTCLGGPTSFTDLTTGTIGTWSWEFGDGTTSPLQDPVHTYATDGNYQVILTVSGSGCSTADTQNVAIELPPTADFSFNTACVGNALQFTDQTTGGGLVNWDWDFGDGNISVLKDPTNTYSNAGSFDVQLVVTDNKGCVDSITQKVTVTGPTASFTNTIACIGDSTDFTDASTGDISTWSWDFGDASPLDNSKSPTHLYAGSGNYSVALTVSDTGGCSHTVTNTVVVTNNIPVADFQISDAVTCSGSSISFYDSSLYTSGWSWDFGDGSTSASQFPTHSYSSSGNFDVALIASNGCGSDTLTKTSAVKINQSPVANFDYSTSDFTVTFTDLSTNAATWLWDYGDGNIASLQNPEYTYSAEGIYSVKLTVTASNGCKNASSQSITLFAIGIEDVHRVDKIQLYPNPSSGVVNLKLENKSTEKLRYTIYNSLGQKILIEEEISSLGNIIQLDLSSLPEGIYYFKLEKNKELVIKKLAILNKF